MEFLVFQLQAPLSSWGDTAVGGYRGGYEHPGESALIGLLGAALGVRRDDEQGNRALREGYGFAVGVQSGGKLLRDYHTSQVPGRSSLKGRPHATRRDELSIPKDELNTILSARDYRQDAESLIAVQARENPPRTLGELMEALRRPCFVLYLGRKSCPLAAPLHPRVVAAESALAAMRSYTQQLSAQVESLKDRWGRVPVESPAPLRKLTWGEGVVAGVQPDLSAPRKDRLITRRGWQFGDRTEHIALFAAED